MKTSSINLLFRIFIVYLIFFPHYLCLGQKNFNIDSLKHQISILNDDTSKVHTFILITEELINSDPPKAIIYGNLAYILSKKINYIPGQIDALYHKSNAYKFTGVYDSSVYTIKKAIDLSDSINDLKRLSDSYFFYSGMLYRTKNPVAGNEYLQKAYKLYMELKDSLGMANAYNLMGVAHKMNSRYDSAVFYYLKFIKLSEQIGYIEGLGKAYVNIGVLYYDLNDFGKAREYLLESIKVNEQFNHLRYIGIAYNNLGSIAYTQQKYDEALGYFNTALEIYEKLDNLYGIANLTNNIANVYEDRKEYNKAFAMFSKAKDIYEKMGDIDGYIAAYKNMALIYEGRRNYEKALAIYDTCLLLAREINSSFRIKEIYYNIYRTYELMQDYTNAFYYLVKYDEIKDSIFNIEKSKTIADLQLKYEKEKDQARILTLENENLEKDLSLRKRTNQRNIYLFSGSGTIAVILFLLVFYRHKARKDKIIADQKIRQLEEEKKLLAARSIVNGQEEERKRIAKELHDGLGVLLSTAKMQFTTLRDKSPENRPLIEKATKLLEQAAGDVRKISHNMMPGLLTKFGLYEAVEDLIEQLDETEGLNAGVEITGDTKRLPENTEIMLYRIIQEMVNNTLKHAQAKNISMSINIQPEILNIKYSDDGIGFDVEEKLESKSIGLTSIQSRVKFLGGELSTESKPGAGAAYVMQIPL